MRVEVHTHPGGMWLMAADLGMMMDGRECVLCLLSLILGIGLLLLCACWLPSGVVEGVRFRDSFGERIDLAAGRPIPQKIPYHC